MSLFGICVSREAAIWQSAFIKSILRITAVNGFLTIAAALVVCCALPDNIAVHMDARGNVDRWSGKWELFVPVALTAACQWLFYAFWRLFYAMPKEKADAGMNLLLWSCTTICAIFSTISTVSTVAIYTLTLI
ncbi:MAG: DUF1648 domain-containing protein [Clostridia bacterium]|nr:DUF1648 domain-containing protein [Clostridia bacterium]